MATIRFRWSNRGYIAIGVVTVAIAAAFGYRGEQFDGVVVRIVDGDTFALQGESREVIVRLWGVDAPEMDQPFGMGAKMALGELCMGETVHVLVADVDQYKRRVCRVTLPDGRDVGEEMVRTGCAWWARKYAPRDEKLKRLEGAARLEKVGLWNHKNPVNPAAWRHTQRRAS